MQAIDLLRFVVPLGLAAFTAFLVDYLAEKRGFLPPGFAQYPLRRGAAAALLATVFWLTLFEPLGRIGQEIEIDLSLLTDFDLFLTQIVLLATAMAWYTLAYGPSHPEGERPVEGMSRQFGLRAEKPLVELGIGAAGGALAWAGVMLFSLGLGGLLVWTMGPDAVPNEPSPAIAWIASRSVATRIALSMAAGLVEEIFFRGFLQARIGIGLSTGLFVLAHASYDQPLMLVSLVPLSLFFAYLAQWRRSIWPAIVAHTVFDLIQLLIVIPVALKYYSGGP